jgi:hypothetical protein
MVFAMKRIFTQTLTGWKDRLNRKPLIVRGARQVGKTWIIEEFGKQYFKSYVKINLEENPELKQIFRTNQVKLIVNEISVLVNQSITPKETLLFIDEIQSMPEAIACLRYFYEQMPELHIIAAGSLLDHVLNDFHYSFPVGRVEYSYMYPMNFIEFLWAMNEVKLVDYIAGFNLNETFSPVIHQKILELLRLYYFIGGMPLAVKTYIETGKLLEVERTHNQIITSIQFDFSKYGNRKQQEYMITTFKYCATKLCKRIKYVNINSEAKSADIKEAIYKLEMSRLLHRVLHTSASQIPLSNLANENVFKTIFLDIGLANHVSKIKLIDIQNIMTAHEGALTEQFIGQELLTTFADFEEPQLHFWVREEKNAQAEIDFLFGFQNIIYPIEVKTGKGGTLKSLQLFVAQYNLSTGIRFNSDLPSITQSKSTITIGKDLQEVNYTLISLPVYFCYFLPQLLDFYTMNINILYFIK